MKNLTFFLCLCLPLFCMAQTLPREYEYDLAGNRTSRKVITVNYAPPAPQDSTFTELTNLDPAIPPPPNLTPHTPNPIPHTPEYFVEKIAQTEIKIFPNPTTEKVTLEISQWETLQKGIFKLYSMTGQLLQERPVHSATTEVSLAGLAKGTYILKVQINDRTEDWKVIKN